MLNSRKGLLILVTAAPLMMGCQSVFGSAYSSRTEVRVADASTDEYASEQAALGKKALDEGNYGSAIIAFSNIRQIPQHSAEAYNGLAIAYSNLGRNDLAETFFQQAVAEAPGDRRYHANLARFYDTTTAAMVRAQRPVAPASKVPALPSGVRLAVEQGNTAITVQTPTSRLVRVSPTEMHIKTEESAMAHLWERAQNAFVKVTQPMQRRNPNYPVHIKLTEKATATTQVAVERAARPYPVKVSFNASDH